MACSVACCVNGVQRGMLWVIVDVNGVQRGMLSLIVDVNGVQRGMLCGVLCDMLCGVLWVTYIKCNEDIDSNENDCSHHHLREEGERGERREEGGGRREEGGGRREEGLTV